MHVAAIKPLASLCLPVSSRGPVGCFSCVPFHTSCHSYRYFSRSAGTTWNGSGASFVRVCSSSPSSSSSHYPKPHYGFRSFGEDATRVCRYHKENKSVAPSSCWLVTSRRYHSSSGGGNDDRRMLSFHIRALGFSPLPEKLSTGGEDAYISSQSVQSVLDGVSWWRDHLSVDAGLYSAALAKHMYEYVEDDLLGDLPASSLRLLQRGYELSKHSNVVGTSTALVATLQSYRQSKERIYKKDRYQWVNLEEWQKEREQEENTHRCLLTDDVEEESEPQLETGAEKVSSVACPSEGKIKEAVSMGENHKELGSSSDGGNGGENKEGETLLDVAFVGDCGLIVIRNGQIVYETEAQQHDVDFPFQLGHGSADTPKDGVRVLIPVRRGDVVVMGSDGIFDNVYSRDICKLMWQALSTSPFYRSDTNPSAAPEGKQVHLGPGAMLDQTLSALNKGIELVLAKATSIANNIRSDSPYASRCIENGANFEGGKPDDMTLLASILEYKESAVEMEKLSEAEELFPSPYRDWP